MANRQCFANHCTETIAGHLIFCHRHWVMLPPAVQTRIVSAAEIETHMKGMPRNPKGDWYEAISAAKRHLANAEAETTQTVLIVGKTWPVREELKALGGVWSPDKKGWLVPKVMKMRAEVLVGNASQVETLDFEENEL